MVSLFFFGLVLDDFLTLVKLCDAVRIGDTRIRDAKMHSPYRVGDASHSSSTLLKPAIQSTYGAQLQLVKSPH